MHYFSHISNTYSLKNKLEKRIFAVLTENDRKIIPAAEIKQFMDGIRKQVEEANTANPRCRPIKLDFWQPGYEKDLEGKDYVLHMGGGICNFHLYASKN